VTPYWDDGRVVLHVGHVLEVLAGLEASSIQTCVTSPPYYGLRSYSTEPQVWGGDSSCSHQFEETAPGKVPAAGYSDKSTLAGFTNPNTKGRQLDRQSRASAWQETAPGKVLTGGTGTASAKQVSNAGSQYGNAWATAEHRRDQADSPPGPGLTGGRPPGPEPRGNGVVVSATCTRCGAWRGELGSEPTPDCLAWARGQEPCSVCFVCHLVVVFRAVRRVLHDSGTVFCNLGDSYSGSGKGPTGHNGIGNQGQRQGFVDQRSDAPGLGPSS
jgi:hypothetical protein